ncbi:ArgP/LysG family DNA-binding transcriptional regulator, partial [Nocardioides sp.]|uniref:ArgP/LysG family DNA-binding transcriptional regulator n=1 Tax=Nocardioides sp. TaxID=35761 RepID=UPI002B2788D8
VLLRRSTPCTATDAGVVVVRLARQTALLYDDLRDVVGGVVGEVGTRRSTDLRVAVNADSLATWFRGVLDEVAVWEGATLRLQVEDQAYSADLLRRGDVLGAVTSESAAVQGCLVERLGILRYRPAASPAFVGRWRGGRGIDLAQMPVVVFDSKDSLQHDLLDARGVPAPPVVHRVPTSADFHEALRRGLGWGMLPLPQLEPDLRAGRLVTIELPGGSGESVDHAVDVELFWQRWRLDSPAMARLTEAVLRAARGLVDP